MRILFLLLLVGLSGPALAEVYKWVDQDGVHYGDTPPSKGAEPVKLPEVSGYKPRQLPASAKAPAKPVPDKGEKVPFHGYQLLSIVSPSNDASLRINNGVVPVVLNLEPQLQEGHELILYLDGKPVPAEGGITNRQISGVERGTHTLVAVVNDAQGKQLIRSISIRFFLHQASVFERQQGENGDGSNGDGSDGDNVPTSPIRAAPRARSAPHAPIYAPKRNP